MNLEAKVWLAENRVKAGENPLLDPEICQKMVLQAHQKYNLDFSYGGWPEDRSVLWHGSYLDAENSYIHLGVDINVPTGTEIAIDFDAEVVRIDDDYPEEGGWGPRVIVKNLSVPIYLIYAHLDREIKCKVGDSLKVGQVFAKVGKAPFNGNWFPHLHVQTITAEYYKNLEENNSWSELDGYGLYADISSNSKLFPDPLQFILLK